MRGLRQQIMPTPYHQTIDPERSGTGKREIKRPVSQRPLVPSDAGSVTQKVESSPSLTPPLPATFSFDAASPSPTAVSHDDMLPTQTAEMQPLGQTYENRAIRTPYPLSAHSPTGGENYATEESPSSVISPLSMPGDSATSAIERQLLELRAETDRRLAQVRSLNVEERPRDGVREGEIPPPYNLVAVRDE
jgi:hypothetical protein